MAPRAEVVMRGGFVALALLMALGGCATVSAADRAAIAGADTAEATIDYRGFAGLTGELRDYRAKRRVSLEQFRRMAGEGDTLILDARSAQAYARGHISGAINLPFTDFTAESLARVIGDNPNRRILIYCNNNFANDAEPVKLKAPPLALNIPTFINLYGYGYKNIYELRDVVDFTDPKVGWVGART